MKKSMRILTVLAAVILLSSFIGITANNFIGTYGVSPSDPAQIKLTINSDHTFYYQDFSVPEKKIIVNGSWTLKGRKVVLAGNGYTRAFHKVWTFDENGQVAKSRKGLTFYRLCRVDAEK